MENSTEGNNIEIEAYDVLKTIIDPELGISIIDLGLVYKIECTEDSTIIIEMTLSSKGCPMGDIILKNVNATLKERFAYHTIVVELVWEPAWSPDFVTPVGRTELGLDA